MTKKCLIILITFMFGITIYNLTLDNLYSCKGNSDEQCVIKKHSIGNINVSFEEDFICLGDGCLERENVIRSTKNNSIDNKTIGELFEILFRIININILSIIFTIILFVGLLFGINLFKKQ